MTVPYSTVMIKPLSVGRGDAPNILSDILLNTPLALRAFRSWRICDNTYLALSGTKGLYDTELDYDVERVHALRPIDSWCMVFTHIDRQTDPYSDLVEYCGPIDYKLWRPDHLRHRYSGITRRDISSNHPSDTVLHISSPTRSLFEALLLFNNFDESLI